MTKILFLEHSRCISVIRLSKKTFDCIDKILLSGSTSYVTETILSRTLSNMSQGVTEGIRNCLRPSETVSKRHKQSKCDLNVPMTYKLCLWISNFSQLIKNSLTKTRSICRRTLPVTSLLHWLIIIKLVLCLLILERYITLILLTKGTVFNLIDT